ncbi:MAG: ATP-binding protein [Candidatus Auribacterota bacterium]|nr:ATP-binding protein [Candidatus Auribacterota bacterium]
MEVDIEQNQIILKVKSDDKYLKLIRAVIREVAVIAEFPHKDINDIVLAVDEACANIIEHTYGGDKTKDIFVKLSLRDGGIEILLRDYGKKLDPVKLWGRKLDDIKPRGLGIYLMKKVMDSVIYSLDNEDGNELVMVKRLKNP